jgi:hypothetical protein
MGIRHSNRRFEMGLAYTLERYDFAEAAGVRRLEEHSSLVLRAGYRLGVGREAK